MRALLVLLGLLLATAAQAQVPQVFAPPCSAAGCDLGTGGITTSGPAGLTGGGTLGGNFGGTLDLTGSGTALSVSNSATFASSGTDPVTITNGQIAAVGNITFATGANGVVSAAAGGDGAFFAFYAPNGGITNYPTFTAGLSGSPTKIETVGTDSTLPLAFVPPSQGSQIQFGIGNWTGTYVSPPVDTYNCGGVAGAITICQNNDGLNYGYSSDGGHRALLNVVKYAGGSGETGPSYTANFSNTINSPTSDTQNAFWQSINLQGTIAANAGGTSAAPLGSMITNGTYCSDNSTSSFVVETSCTEEDVTIASGATVQKSRGHSIIVFSTAAAVLENTAYALGGGNYMDCFLCAGRYDAPHNGLSARAMLLGFFPPAGTGTSDEISDGVDTRLGSFSNAAFDTTGGSWNGSTFNLGHAWFTDSAAGLTVTPTGSQATTATVTTAGSGYVATLGTTTTPAPLNAKDAYHGIWKLTVSGGAVTAVTNISPSFVEGTPPTTLTLTSEPGQPGSGAVITPTWTTGSNVTIAGGTQIQSTVVASLPTCDTAEEGTLYYVTDATSPTYNGTLTGGGSAVVPAFCNGSAWTAH